LTGEAYLRLGLCRALPPGDLPLDNAPLGYLRGGRAREACLLLLLILSWFRRSG